MMPYIKIVIMEVMVQKNVQSPLELNWPVVVFPMNAQFRVSLVLMHAAD